jgi:hypothetical protein
MAVTTKSTILWDMTTCSIIEKFTDDSEECGASIFWVEK